VEKQGLEKQAIALHIRKIFTAGKDIEMILLTKIPINHQMSAYQITNDLPLPETDQFEAVFTRLVSTEPDHFD